MNKYNYKPGHYAGICLAKDMKIGNWITQMVFTRIDNGTVLDNFSCIMIDHLCFAVSITILPSPESIGYISPEHSIITLKVIPDIDMDLFNDMCDKCSFKFVGDFR